MAAHGYEGQSVLTDSSEFGLPARRRRLYIFLVRVQGNPLLSFQDRSVDSIFTTFGGLLAGCVRHDPVRARFSLKTATQQCEKSCSFEPGAGKSKIEARSPPQLATGPISV